MNNRYTYIINKFGGGCIYRYDHENKNWNINRFSDNRGWEPPKHGYFTHSGVEDALELFKHDDNIYEITESEVFTEML